MFVKFRKFQPQYSYEIYILFKKNKEFIHEINHYAAVTLSPSLGIYPVDSSIYLLKKTGARIGSYYRPRPQKSTQFYNQAGQCWEKARIFFLE